MITLPAEFSEAVVQDVVETLKAFSTARVIRENGIYTTTTGVCLTNSDNSDDFKVWEFHKDSFFSADEQVENYVNEFKDYPAEYKGRRNYSELRKLDGVDTYRNDTHVAVMVDGNIEIVECEN